ncbi:MAG TPA: DUF169 domain-containing protein [Syntrophorhabdaceae bacterium]|nr:DUF169 domain-containing protein [Syntrophorhabdaceae bacterium]
MDWKDSSAMLQEVLKLERHPIAVTYSMVPADGGKDGHHWVCRALQDASGGSIINLTKDNSACHGGTWHLGLGPKPTGDADRALKKFLVEGEKLFCSIAAFYRGMTLTAQPPLGLADYVVISPLGKAQFRPDLVLFLCNAEQACRILTLATYDSGVSPKTELVGSACHMAITYPLVSGEINVSFMDYTARKMKGYKADELFVSVPYHRMAGIIESIPLCTAGTAKTDYPPEFRQLVGGALEDVG